MFRHRNTYENGFVHVKLLIIVGFAVVITGFVGWKVFSANTTAGTRIASHERKEEALIPEGVKKDHEDTKDEAPDEEGTESPEVTGNNDSTLTVTEDTTMTPDYYGQPGSKEYRRINFIIHNNSSYEQTYGSNYGANYMIRGLTTTNEVKEPLVLPGAILWQSSTIVAGGTAEGFVLFRPEDKIVRLEWKVPSNAETLYYTIPAEQ